ncbi:MAG: ATP-binding domain-containing protein [Actinobacteria bacterium]|nr:ATP-binding domain-containing protein [Actinomycetota bacterium]
MTHPDTDAEQAYFDALYARLDDEIAKVEERLAEVRLSSPGGQHQARFEREVFAGHLEERASMLRAQRRDDLCFGRIDLLDGSHLYIGRLGLAGDDHEPVLVDWRAPAAAPFYQATPRDRLDVVRRRHFLSRNRRIVTIEDDVLDAEALPEGAARTLRGEAALQYAMNTARTGRMREIAATIQKEQDEIIRAPLTPALLVQGGPGTGKTAVALHRAAYLLYTHRQQLSARHLLVIGPNPLFLRYIENVLPSLGESGADLSSVPQVYARQSWQPESGAVATVKARPEMVEVIRRAVATRQRPLRRPVTLNVEGERVTINPRDTRRIMAEARQRPGTHNQRAAHVHGRLLRLVWRTAGRPLQRIWEYEDFRQEWLTHPRFRRLSQRVWPVLTPEQLLNDAFGFPALLREATHGVLTDEEAASLARSWSPDPGEVAWTEADAPLLDEAASQLGPIPAQVDPAHRRPGSQLDDEEAMAEAEYTRQLARGLGGGVVSRQVIEERYGIVSARPGGDDDEDGGRLWRYAVIDEAQDVSPLAWRMIGRHCPRRALTIVGDVAQGSEPWASGSWDVIKASLDAGPSPAEEWATLAELTINYRTPLEVAEYAAPILARIDPSLAPPDSVRSVPGSLATERAPSGEGVDWAVEGALRLHGEVDDGVAAVIVAPSALADARAALERRTGLALPEPTDPAVLDSPVVVMTPSLAKGLEFDVVVLADPARLVEECGWRALYVGATRATRSLLVVHTGESPIPTG